MHVLSIMNFRANSAGPRGKSYMLRCHATNTAAGQRAKLRNGLIIIEAKCHTIIKPIFYYLGPFFFSFSASLAATGGEKHT